MTITISNYADLQKNLSALVAANGLTPALAPHGVFYEDLDYNQFITQDMPGVPGFKIVEVGNAAASNIVMALSGTAGSAFDPNTGSIGPMPQPSPPYNTETPTQADIIAALTVWINDGCPNNQADTAVQSKTY